MIDKQNILERAAEWRLRADVVEKDYVLGWLLIAAGSHSGIRQQWVLKGGTCLKKCFFETFRFSEDLDFSLSPTAAYASEAIQQMLIEMTEKASEISGVEFPRELVSVRERHNRQQQTTFEGKVGYRGPLRNPSPPRVLFDITQHEPILAPIDSRRVFHPYPDDDAVPAEVTVATYSLNELLAEKVRALLERTRPRDLYDVVHILENRSNDVQLYSVRSLFHQKCTVKDITPPSSAELIQRVQGFAELRSEWSNMLAHQLPMLPPLDPMLERLPDLLRWIDAAAPVQPLELPAVPGSEEVLASPAPQYWGYGVPLEVVRFAGATRVMIEFGYHERRRVAEPYSLRRAGTGNVLLYAWEEGSDHIKAFKVDEMIDVRATDRTFRPRYRIEFTSIGSVSIPSTPTTRESNVRAPRPPSPRGIVGRHGPVYVFKCGFCGKEFRHRTNNPTLRRHNTQNGSPCGGRRGYHVRTEFR